MRSSTVVYAVVAALVQAHGLAAWTTPSANTTTVYTPPTSVPVTTITTIYTTSSYSWSANSTGPGHSVPTDGLPPAPGPHNSTIIPPPGNGGGAPTPGPGNPPTNVPVPPTTTTGLPEIPTGAASANRVGGLLAAVGVAAVYLL